MRWEAWPRRDAIADRSSAITCHSKPYVNVGETQQLRLLLHPSFFSVTSKTVPSFFYCCLFSLSLMIMMSNSNCFSEAV